MEILSWLPVKDLLLFKCVSKGWNQLVFDSAFVKLHLQRSSKNTHTLLTFLDDSLSYRRHCAIVCPIQDLFENPSSTLETLPHSYLPFNGKRSILGSCNGLVCLQDSFFHGEFKEYWFPMGNPATRVMSNEPPHIRINLSDYKYPFRLVYGFGYDEWSDTYQVVLLDNNKNKSQKLEVKVCSLGDNCWRNTFTCEAVPIKMDNRLRGICGAFVSGTLNWLAYPKSRAGDDERGGTKMNELEIFSYDLKKESCSYFCMPDGILEVSPNEAVLEVLNGCLCLSHYHENDFIVWLKRDFRDEKSWSKLLHYKNRPSPCYYTRYIDIICMCENDDVVLLADTGLYSKSEFIWWNIRDNRMEGRQIFDKYKFYLSSYDYVHSLVLP
ncbi:F-box/kelch-repeat protein At3g23880-like [Vigna radiata var. radiata]|uniref:F-box/kelch-repeat protein At3g23880-like n=1 Tax=Vigna radiata var. radiata TaxID=3916 RepID=A0A1S3UZI3_VIGRR|nr:F-box/kelch-repeat protein At3g23880-like [Vigna radiata var. radiata]